MEGVELFYREFGNAGNDNKLVILHGLYGSSDNWVSIARQLEKEFHIFVPDQRNHGRSPHTPTHTYEGMVADLLQFVTTHRLKNINLLGHSMGGKTAMLFALNHPGTIKKLIVADISPRSYSEQTNYGEITNNHRHIIESLKGLTPHTAQSRQELDAQLSATIPSPALRQFLLKNIDRNEAGKFEWRLNLPVVAESLSEVMDGFSDISETLSANISTVFIKGELSPYIQEADLLNIRKRFKQAQVVSIPGAGHWLHAEQPELFFKTLCYFLEE